MKIGVVCKIQLQRDDTTFNCLVVYFSSQNDLVLL